MGVIRGADDMLVHANHLEATDLCALETPSENSLCRRRRLQALIEGATAPLTVAQIRTFYRDHADHPHSLCAHPFEGRNVKTVASVIGDLTARAARRQGLAVPRALCDLHPGHLPDGRPVRDGRGPIRRRILTRLGRGRRRHCRRGHGLGDLPDAIRDQEKPAHPGLVVLRDGHRGARGADSRPRGR